MRPKSSGKCQFCNEIISKSAMKRHLKDCTKRKEIIQQRLENKKIWQKRCQFYLVKIQAMHNKNYWIYLDIKETATLKDLDAFLRELWLDCCGHLSQFIIKNVYYLSKEALDDIMNDMYLVLVDKQPQMKSINVQVKNVFKVGTKFTYEYDLGSTTTLEGFVHETRPGTSKEDNIQLLARNTLLKTSCVECSTRKAQYLCIECLTEFGNRILLCPQHADEHGCGTKNLTKILNSPRFGVCGYY